MFSPLRDYQIAVWWQSKPAVFAGGMLDAYLSIGTYLAIYRYGEKEKEIK